MFSVQGLIIMFMFGYAVAILVEGLLQMYRESKAIREEENKEG